MGLDFTYEDEQQILPRYGNGCDYGAERKVVFRNDETGDLLYIRKGFSDMACGVAGFGSKYNPITLEFLPYDDPVSEVVLEGGRMSEKRFRQNTGLIDEAVGMPGSGLGCLLDPKRTLVFRAGTLIEGNPF